ncbi:MAG: hypothetical protein GY952_10230 [Rhodobacteraceae bacterium]|nr:hypothetical protein [Paracoccaceae bacterium]
MSTPKRRSRKALPAGSIRQQSVRRPARKTSLPVIDADGSDRIFTAVLDVLGDCGIEVSDPEAVSLLVSAGCRADSGRVYYPPDLVCKSLEKIPAEIAFYRQDGGLALTTSESVPRFGTGVNCVNVLDPRTDTYRPCLLSDIRDHGRMQQALPYIDFASSLGYPSDVPAEREALECARALLETTQKPIFFTGHDEHSVQAIWETMANCVGGMDNLADKPIGLDLIGPVSPLKLGREACQRLIMAARLGLPVVCYPAIFPGMSCPLSLAGAIAQATAESLSGIVLSQIVQPGAPVMSGSSVMPMDMRRADMAIGSPEYALAGLGAADVFAHIGIPCWVGSGCTDAHDIGPQAQAEASAGLLATSLASTSLTHNLGMLSSGRTGSMEFLVACDELAAMASTFAAGIEVSEATIAKEVIARAAPENTFLTDPHTMDRFETEFWMPNLFRRESLEDWQQSDSSDFRKRLKEKTLSLLDAA